MKTKELRERFAAETTGEQPPLTNYAKWLEKKLNDRLEQQPEKDARLRDPEYWSEKFKPLEQQPEVSEEAYKSLKHCVDYSKHLDLIYNESPIKTEHLREILNALQSHHPRPISDVARLFPTDDDIEQDGKDGGLKGNELQMYWEGGVWMKRYMINKLQSHHPQPLSISEERIEERAINYANSKNGKRSQYPHDKYHSSMWEYSYSGFKAALKELTNKTE